jgi:hypothetical protein
MSKRPRYTKEFKDQAIRYGSILKFLQREFDPPSIAVSGVHNRLITDPSPPLPPMPS